MFELINNVLDGPFGKLNIIKDENNNPWFIGKEVCDKLGIKNVSDAINGRKDRLYEDGLLDCEKGIDFVDTPGGQQKMLLVNESGLYALIFKSRKPEAVQFRYWVTSVLIPWYRKTIGYEFMATYQSKIDMAETFLETDNAISMSDFADSIHSLTGMGRNRLFQWLRDNTYLTDNNVPYAKYIHQGIFKVVQKPIDFGNWSKTQSVTLVTPKGCLYFTKVFKKKEG